MAFGPAIKHDLRRETTEAQAQTTVRGNVRITQGTLEVESDTAVVYRGGGNAIDRAVLRQAVTPVLDIGCGPGRHLAALAAAGREGLGLDLSPVAVRIARARGAEAILRSVFADVPRTGTWRTALLLDGNFGYTLQKLGAEGPDLGTNFGLDVLRIPCTN